MGYHKKYKRTPTNNTTKLSPIATDNYMQNKCKLRMIVQIIDIAKQELHNNIKETKYIIQSTKLHVTRNPLSAII